MSARSLNRLTTKVANARGVLISAKLSRGLSEAEAVALDALDLYMEFATAAPQKGLLAMAKRMDEQRRDLAQIDRLLLEARSEGEGGTKP